MSPRLGGVLLILVGAMLIWFSADSARNLVASKRSPLPYAITRGIYIVGGIVAFLAGIRVLFWPE